MRLRTESTETAGRRPNGRIRMMKLPRFWGGQRVQPNVSNSSTIDGNQPLQEEEPPKEIFTFKQRLEAQQFSEASQLLIERETRLFGGIKEAEPLKDHEEESARLADDYRELESHVWQTLKLSLSPEVSMTTLTSAVEAVYQEVEQDKQWQQSTNVRPGWRPSNWSNLHDETLRNLVKQRMDNPSTPPAAQVKQSCFQAEISGMVRQLKEDLLLVVEVVRHCYPPQLDICNFYASLYHQCLSARLKSITEYGLDDRDSQSLLLWVNQYYPEIFQKPELAKKINVEALGKLLPKESLQPLEEQFLSKQKDELSACINRVLEVEKTKWSRGEEPSKEDGCYVSDEAYDIIQCIHGKVKSAGKVVGDQDKAQDITHQLKDLMQRRKTFQNDIIKQNKPNSRLFIKANLDFIERFSEVLDKESSLFSKDIHKNFKHILLDMRQSAHAYLLKPVHEVLKPHYRKLGTSEWLKQPLFEELLDRVQHELQDLEGCTESCHQKLMCQMHQEVAEEYVRRLLKGGLKLKDRALQLQAYNTMKDEAESLHDFFTGMGSREDWLKVVLINIAEVLKLQDLSTIQLQVASLGKAFPDFSEKHVSALLKLKTNLSKSDRKEIKETLLETLKEITSDDARPFFSKVPVK